MYKEQANFLSFKKCFKDLVKLLWQKYLDDISQHSNPKLYILWEFYQLSKDEM